ncbi:acyltransferase [Paucibacter sp. PLA-PC-4]|uniref:acyltransferase family protein n=1 Tax=Paucibacter sp. PLA-PC-4 TaxID=2993655 RepID=UPI00224AFEF2|nr:acyltransferase [Paucibacter sp. PLA-PC-4]MCX2865014.1 acyltransferase [Paucibacter sp. PLA-PC-4]
MTTRQPSSNRLQEIDALRGIAALMVVLFHFTSKFDELYGHVSAPAFALPWGHYGVNLFFMISGFVIFMTLARTREPADFIVSRFSRLYPAYWFAVGLTFGVTAWLGLPGKTVGWGDAILNLLMFHSLFKVPNVDGVYWTLLVELLFYAWSLLAFRLGLLARIHLLLAAALALRLVYFVAAQAFGIDLPWTLSQLLILPFISWFACGIMVYRLSHDSSTRGLDWALVTAAVLTLGITESPFLGALAAALTVLLYLAASRRLPLLRIAVLTWLGEISYTLYLVHENIGWAVLLRLKAHGFDPNVSIAIVIALSLLLAWAITRCVEKPAMALIRSRYRQRQTAAVPT